MTCCGPRTMAFSAGTRLAIFDTSGIFFAISVIADDARGIDEVHQVLVDAEHGRRNPGRLGGQRHLVALGVRERAGIRRLRLHGHQRAEDPHAIVPATFLVMCALRLIRHFVPHT